MQLGEIALVTVGSLVLVAIIVSVIVVVVRRSKK